jgi:glycosyltransferase involved in cell wall biosynthesis
MTKIVIFQLDNFRLSPFSRNLFNLVPELQKRHYQVDLLVTSNLGLDSLPSGVTAQALGQWVPRWLRLPRHYLAIPELAAYIRRHRPDAIIARGVPFAVPTLIARWLARCTPTVVTTLHASISGDIGARVHRSWPIFTRLARFVIARADHTVAVSAGVARDYTAFTKASPGKIKVIYNPVVGSDIRAQAAEPVDEPWLASGRTHKTLLHIGRFAPEKDHQTLFKALAEVRRERDVRLLLIGDGPLRPAITQAISDLGLESAVRLLGRRENPFAYMAKADAFVLSSKFEGLPGALIQAMAVGCPVASTDCESGADEILENGRWGPLTPVGDHMQLARSIFTVLDEPLAKEALLARAQCFTAAQSAEKLSTLIREDR